MERTLDSLFSQPSEREFTRGRTGLPGAGTLIPATLILLFAIEIFHWVFPQRFIDSPFLRATLGAKADAPFAANFRMRTDRVDGDLQGTLPPSETIGPIVFSTDALGFRVTPGADAKTARVLIALGRSYLWGSGLSDDAALPAQYTRLSSTPAFNGGRYADDEDGLPELERLLAHLPRVRRVYLMVLERTDLVPSNEASHAIPYRVWRRLGFSEDTWRSWIRQPYRELARQVGRRRETSLVRHIGRLLQRSLERRSVLPANATRSSVHYLWNGNRILTRPEEDARLAAPPADDQVEATVAAVSEFAVALKQRGYEVSAVLMPDKLTVYAPYLRDRFPGAHNAGLYLERLGVALRGRGIEVINPLPEFRRAAAEELSGGCQIYYRDDTHWTACGTEIVAAVMASRDARDASRQDRR